MNVGDLIDKLYDMPKEVEVVVFDNEYLEYNPLEAGAKLVTVEVMKNGRLSYLYKDSISTKEVVVLE